MNYYDMFKKTTNKKKHNCKHCVNKQIVGGCVFGNYPHDGCGFIPSTDYEQLYCI